MKTIAIDTERIPGSAKKLETAAVAMRDAETTPSAKTGTAQEPNSTC